MPDPISQRRGCWDDEPPRSLKRSDLFREASKLE
jgi:hypothetical protein